MGSFPRRQLLHGAVAAAVLSAAPRVVQAQVQDGARAAMARAAAAFVAALEPGQRQAALFPLGHDERRNWHYIPRSRSRRRVQGPVPRRPRGRARADEGIALGRGLRQGRQRGEARGGPAPAGDLRRLPARSREVLRQRLRRARGDGPVGLAPRGASSVAQLHAGSRPPPLRHARVLRRQSGRGALGAAARAARAGRGAGSRVRPRAWRRREPARPSRHRRRVARATS